ncbi:rifin [Plasmodium reichenowi]|uniref:Rifin n=1 Tax=Plasmodium reichenowi TaxID=5854 RepID=A0A060RMC6_PLARE|nr:rifin [Plasmodium reichenowi]
MKVQYINILLFVLPLNILEHNQRNHYITTYTYINRSLCECELYELVNYDNDPQMKAVMDNFNKQTQQRFHEYDERMVEKRKQCKDLCDKEIQKIILKDKLEKQMAQQLDTLETKIDTNDIPTCICEKSLADKVEKGCLRCGYGLGTVAPTVGLIGSVAVNVWKPKALEAAIAAAIELNTAKITGAASAAGMNAGKSAVIGSLKTLGIDEIWPEMSHYILEMSHYNDVENLTAVINTKHYAACWSQGTAIEEVCEAFNYNFGISNADGSSVLTKYAIPKKVTQVVEGANEVAAKAAKAAEATETATIKAAEEKTIEAASTQLYGAIGYSILAIVVIVLIMVIIYLVLRYRRKKKMKKKLQYIKLLEE